MSNADNRGDSHDGRCQQCGGLIGDDEGAEKCTCVVWKDGAELPAAAPAPSGDDAKVRELARAEAESIATRWVPAHMTARQGMVDDITASLVRYRALGRDDARRGSEGK